MLFLMGGLGALIYGLIAFHKDYETKGWKSASVTLASVVFTGIVFGGVFTPAIGHKYPWAIQPASEPLALAVGLMANPVLPFIIEKGKGLLEVIFGKFKG